MITHLPYVQGTKGDTPTGKKGPRGGFLIVEKGPTGPP